MASFELQYFEADGKTLIRTERLDIPAKTFRKENPDVCDRLERAIRARIACRTASNFSGDTGGAF